MVVAEDGEAAPTTAVAALPPRQLGVVAAVGLITALLDQLTKAWVVANLDDGHSVKVVWTLELRLAHNPGAAFSVGANGNLGPLIAVLVVVIVGVLIGAGSTTRTRAGALSVGLIAGGGVGNLIDRAFRDGSGFLGGHVVDFIYLDWWPTFNVADMGVVVGAIALVLFGLRTPPAPAG